MAKKLLVTIIHPPYGTENAFAGFYIAMASLSKGIDASVLLICDGVYTALKNQKEPQDLLHLPSIEKQLTDILELGGRILIDAESAETRGVRHEECIKGVEFISEEERIASIEDYGELIVTL